MNQSLTTDVDVRGEHHLAHEAEHDSRLQHHFATFEQQFDAAKIGMWLFLATEVLLFGGLFVGFALQQAAHPLAFLEAHHHLDKRLGALNTVVLLFFELHCRDGSVVRSTQPAEGDYHLPVDHAGVCRDVPCSERV